MQAGRMWWGKEGGRKSRGGMGAATVILFSFVVVALLFFLTYFLVLFFIPFLVLWLTEICFNSLNHCVLKISAFKLFGILDEATFANYVLK